MKKLLIVAVASLLLTSQVFAQSCDVNACSTAHPTFRASDCTYQLNNGTRQVCTGAAAVSTPETSILQTLHDDAIAASADAKANNDIIAQTCYDAIANVADAKMNASVVPGGAALLAFQKARDFAKLNSSPIGTSLIVGCAPLVQDAKVNFIQFFANIGGAVLLKGIIPLP